MNSSFNCLHYEIEWPKSSVFTTLFFLKKIMKNEYKI